MKSFFLCSVAFERKAPRTTSVSGKGAWKFREESNHGSQEYALPCIVTALILSNLYYMSVFCSILLENSPEFGWLSFLVAFCEYLPFPPILVPLIPFLLSPKSSIIFILLLSLFYFREGIEALDAEEQVQDRAQAQRAQAQDQQGGQEEPHEAQEFALLFYISFLFL